MCASACLYVCLCVNLSIYLSVCLSVCLSRSLSAFCFGLHRPWCIGDARVFLFRKVLYKVAPGTAETCSTCDKFAQVRNENQTNAKMLRWNSKASKREFAVEPVTR